MSSCKEESNFISPFIKGSIPISKSIRSDGLSSFGLPNFCANESVTSDGNYHIREWAFRYPSYYHYDGFPKVTELQPFVEYNLLN